LSLISESGGVETEPETASVCENPSEPLPNQEKTAYWCVNGVFIYKSKEGIRSERSNQEKTDPLEEGSKMAGKTILLEWEIMAACLEKLTITWKEDCNCQPGLKTYFAYNIELLEARLDSARRAPPLGAPRWLLHPQNWSLGKSDYRDRPGIHQNSRRGWEIIFPPKPFVLLREWNFPPKVSLLYSGKRFRFENPFAFLKGKLPSKKFFVLQGWPTKASPNQDPSWILTLPIKRGPIFIYFLVSSALSKDQLFA